MIDLKLFTDDNIVVCDIYVASRHINILLYKGSVYLTFIIVN